MMYKNVIEETIEEFDKEGRVVKRTVRTETTTDDLIRECGTTTDPKPFIGDNFDYAPEVAYAHIVDTGTTLKG